jgi:nucleoside-diphosphate-sugar epimerase
VLLALTGATGFLGRHLVPAARAAGHRVRALAQPGERTDADEPVTGSLEDPEALRALVAGADAVVHLAAAGVQSRDRAWERMIRANVAAPVALVEAAASAGAGRLVAAGTCLEYAGHGRLPDAPWTGGEARCAEESPLEAADPYGATKAAGGLLLRARARELSLPCWYLRLASLYGPGDDPAKLLPGAIAAAAAHRPFEMTAGEQVREWLHVDDAVAALLAALGRDPGPGGEILNAGTGEGVALVELVRRAFAVAGADPALVRAGVRPYRPGDPHHLVMDPRRAERRLGWRATTSLDAGLAPLVAGATGGRNG